MASARISLRSASRGGPDPPNGGSFASFLFDELGVGLWVRQMPRFEKDVELQADEVVPDRREPRHLDCVRADTLCDKVASLQEVDETGEIGYVLDSNLHPQLSQRSMSAIRVARSSLRPRDFS